MKLDGEIALVAGATSGIGLATAGKGAGIVLTTAFLKRGRHAGPVDRFRQRGDGAPDRSAPSWHDAESGPTW